jgi:hypothetical protein
MLEQVGSLDALVAQEKELESALASVEEEIAAEKSVVVEGPVSTEPEHALGLKHPDPSEPDALPPF